MRYLVQFVVPLLIFLAAVVFATQRRNKGTRAGGEQGAGDFGMFLAILVVGAAAAVGIAWATQSWWSSGP